MCRVSSCAISSRCSRSLRATACKIASRLPGATSRQPDSHTRCADSTAAFTSATSAAATSPKGSSVAGLMSVVRRSEAELRQAPSRKSWAGRRITQACLASGIEVTSTGGGNGFANENASRVGPRPARKASLCLLSSTVGSRVLGIHHIRETMPAIARESNRAAAKATLTCARQNPVSPLTRLPDRVS